MCEKRWSAAAIGTPRDLPLRVQRPIYAEYSATSEMLRSVFVRSRPNVNVGQSGDLKSYDLEADLRMRQLPPSSCFLAAEAIASV